VLPVLPIVFGTAASTHRHGPIALSAGVALSFTAIGLFLATIGFSLGLDQDVFRTASAAMLILFGGLLFIPKSQYALQSALQPIGDWANGQMNRYQADGLAGQFSLGALLGAMWSPCVGPTLGAASVLASQGESLPLVTLAMLLFGIGASIPLILIGTLFRRRFAKMRAGFGTAGQIGRQILGGAMLLVGAFVLTGLDKILETLFLDHAPSWLTSFATQI
jgi:cytochrome c-type biogenesis protein